MSRACLAAMAALCLGLSACSERPQTATHRKADGHAYDGPATAFTVAGWKPGDAASWEDQMRSRSQGQNEYSRSGAMP